MEEIIAIAKQSIQPSFDMEQTKKKLCSSVMKGEWREVLKIYRGAEVQAAGITFSKETALHMAIYENKEEIVEKLVQQIDRKTDVIQSTDNKGNTPLHLAAKLGSCKMCECIASKSFGLISCRNNDGETPMFLAALHGKKDAFVLLYLICCLEENIRSSDDDRLYTYGRRKDGRTVLHCAIDGEYFDLAFQILTQFPTFTHCVDERGQTPLHLLASKHTAFRTSCHLTWMQTLIYACTRVDIPRMTIDGVDIVKLTMDMDIDIDIPIALPSTSDKTGDVENPPRCEKQCSFISWVIMKVIKPSFQTVVAQFQKAVISLISGISRTRDLFPKHVAEIKEKHVQSIQIMKLLVQNASYYDYGGTGSQPTSPHIPSFDDTPDEKPHVKKHNYETPILIAAKNGIEEIVNEFLGCLPVAIHDVNFEGKNLVLLAVENRQPSVYKLLLEREHTKNNLLCQVDNNGNNVLHLAANLEVYRPWLAPKAILQMQWEIKWYEYIKARIPGYLLVSQNKKGKTPEGVFMETHADLVKNDTEWLMKTSDSCIIVATLIATVAFATSASVPGGVSGRNGEPVLTQQGMFDVFAISSLAALCFSLTAALMFLSILTSRHQVMDFGFELPAKLLFGLTALFLSIASMLVSFCGGHFFVLKNVLKDAKVAEYVVAFIPVLVFMMAQFPLYFKLILATIKKVPERGFIVTIGSEDRGEPAKAEACTKESPSQPSPSSTQ